MPGKPPARHQSAPTGRGRYRRIAAWLTALTLPGALLAVAAVWLANGPAAGGISSSVHTAPPTGSAAPVARPADVNSAATVSRGALAAAQACQSQAPGGSGLVLSAQERRSCPRTATACADLRDHVTWLQSGGRVTYGPVRMEPGARRDPTPRGTFRVAWKAGAHYISTSFGIPIPYAVFFAAGGIAFHAGSLSSSSHGCIHLRLADARHYHDHLPTGAEVVVF